MASEQSKEIHQVEETIGFAEFLESVPPATLKPITQIIANYQTGYRVSTPEIHFHCSDESCNGMRFFRWAGKHKPTVPSTEISCFYLTYRCSNCQRTEKTFSLAAQENENDFGGEC